MSESNAEPEVEETEADTGEAQPYPYDEETQQEDFSEGGDGHP